MKNILGLKYLPNWIDETTETLLLDNIQQGFWESSLQRRVQQFGPVYNYTTRKLDLQSQQEIPQWLKKSLYSNLITFFDEEPNQIIINEYQPGQNITKHIDAAVFGPVIASLSLLGNTNMTFGQYRDSEIKHLLERRSLLVLSDEARNKWYHYIAPVTQQRISITFRTILR